MPEVLRAALIGRDVARSPSPVLHDMLFSILGQNSDYEQLDYRTIECHSPLEVVAALGEASQNGYRGLNLTTPFKSFIADHFSHVTRDVKTMRSGNTVLFRPNPRGYSTDGLGFLAALERRVAIDYSEFELVVFGSGGAARSILATLHYLPWKSITVFARTVDGTALIAKHFPNVRIKSYDMLDSPRTAKRFFVQATTVGYNSSEDVAVSVELREDDIACDIVYSPLETAFLKRARSVGMRTIDGLGMLIEQAAIAQQLWITGKFTKSSPLSTEQFMDIYDRLLSTRIS